MFRSSHDGAGPRCTIKGAGEAPAPTAPMIAHPCAKAEKTNEAPFIQRRCFSDFARRGERIEVPIKQLRR